MDLIVAADRNCAIGKKGDLLYSLPEDMKYFRAKTLGKTVVMGQKTLESFPGGKPLPKRTNIVISDDPAFTPDGVVIVRSFAELFAEIAKYCKKHKKQYITALCQGAPTVTSAKNT